jgi:hypothetical protein
MLFLGVLTAAPVVNITAKTVQDIGANNPASAGYRLTNAGTVFLIPAGTPTGVGAWITPQIGMGDYEARATVSGGNGLGTLTGSATATWLNLGTTRTWTLSSGTSGLFCESVLTVEIRDVATSTVLTSATITLQVEAL